MADGLRDRLPDLRHVLAVGGEGERSFEAALIDRRWEDELDAEAIFAAGRPGSDEVVELIYTSGTTGEPKGVMHTSNTLHAAVLPFIERNRLGPDSAAFIDRKRAVKAKSVSVRVDLDGRGSIQKKNNRKRDTNVR